MLKTKGYKWKNYLYICLKRIASDISKTEFRDLKATSLPKIAGVYVISNKDSIPLYVGRTKNLRQRIYNNHLMGPLTSARLKKYLIHAKVCENRGEAKKFIRDRCNVRWIKVLESRKRGAVEGYITGKLFPKYGIEDEH